MQYSSQRTAPISNISLIKQSMTNTLRGRFELTLLKKLGGWDGDYDYTVGQTSLHDPIITTTQERILISTLP